MKNLITLICLLFAFSLYSQVGIGTTNPNEDAILHIKSNSKGVLFPHIPLHSTVLPDPMSQFVSGMVVYNYVTRNDVSPGLYVSDGLRWIKLDEQFRPKMNFITLPTEITVNSLTFVPVLPITFTATTTSAALDFSAFGKAATGSSAGIEFRILNITTAETIADKLGTHMQDHAPGGTTIPWNLSYSGIIENMTVGTTYTILVEAKTQVVVGSNGLTTINPATLRIISVDQ